MSIRVAFDVTAQIAGATGIARYQAELSLALERIGVQVDRFAFGRASQPVAADVRHVKAPGRVLYPSWRWLGLPSIRSLAPHASLVHTGAPVLPRTKVPIVATVHDLDAIEFPELHPPRSVEQLQSMLATIGRAAEVIAVSEHVAATLRARGIPSERVTVVHHGVPQLGRPSGASVPTPYLLAIGQLMARKGFDVLLRAFARGADSLRGHRLVIAGPAGGQSEELERLRGELGLTDRVDFVGLVSDRELAGLYRGASAVCVPSVAEGFGLPVLEAMAGGAPVVCSDLPVLREVSGGHALFAPVGDVAAWADALARIVGGEAGLADRLRDRGRAWAAGFTWESAAEKTLDVYERAAHGVGWGPGSPP